MEMQDKEKKCFVSIQNYTGEKPIEIIYREDSPAKHADIIPAKLPQPVNISGTIATVREFLAKRVDLLNIDNCRLAVNRDKSTLTLHVNEHDARPMFGEWSQSCMSDADFTIKNAPHSTITGKIEYTKDFLSLHINEDYWWTPAKLSKFLRLNRALFGKDKEGGMKLISDLKNVTGKITGEYIKKTELHDKISKVEYMVQNIEHNLPKSFCLELSIFKGAPKRRYDVEFDADVFEGDIKVQLISPEMNEDVAENRDNLIDNELDAIELTAPRLVVTEE